MKTEIEVRDRAEARWLKAAMSNPAMREYVVFAGKLLEIDADYVPRIIADASDILRARLDQERATVSHGDTP